MHQDENTQQEEKESLHTPTAREKEKLVG